MSTEKPQNLIYFFKLRLDLVSQKWKVPRMTTIPSFQYLQRSGQRFQCKRVSNMFSVFREKGNCVKGYGVINVYGSIVVLLSFRYQTKGYGYRSGLKPKVVGHW